MLIRASMMPGGSALIIKYHKNFIFKIKKSEESTIYTRHSENVLWSGDTSKTCCPVFNSKMKAQQSEKKT